VIEPDRNQQKNPHLIKVIRGIASKFFWESNIIEALVISKRLKFMNSSAPRLQSPAHIDKGGVDF